MGAWTLYVDLDAYYVACEVRDRPELADRSVIVGPDPSKGATRGVVLSASYAARKFGVRSAMPVRQAAERVPDAVWIPPDFAKYERIAGEVRALLARFAERVVPLSIDEAALAIDADGPEAARAAALRVQSAVRDELRLSASLGVAEHRTVAKIASDRAKPGGVVVVAPGSVAEFLAPLAVRSIPGVGPKAEERLAALGVRTIGELALRRPAELRGAFGGFAEELVALARGRPRPLPPDPDLPRSRSSDRTYPADVTDLEPLLAELPELAESVASSLRNDRLVATSVGVAVRWEDFGRTQRSRTGAHAVQGADEIGAEARRLLEQLWKEERRGRGRAARTVSVRVEGLRRSRGRQRRLGPSDGPSA